MDQYLRNSIDGRQAQPRRSNAAKYLLFIDTNIWLDFYRIETGEGAAESLKLVAHARNRIILTSQVEMEFMKNCQNAILLTLGQFKSADKVTVPPIIADAAAAAAAARTMKAAKKAMDERRDTLKKRVERILLNPASHDPVYKTLQSLFAEPTDLVLGRENKSRHTIRGWRASAGCSATRLARTMTSRSVTQSTGNGSCITPAAVAVTPSLSAVIMIMVGPMGATSF
jgi:predicted nucleic acid-binding protein